MGKSVLFRVCRTAGALLFIAACAPAWSATAGLGLQPGRIELEVNPGSQRTAAFTIESPPSEEIVRGRLLLSLTDWDLGEDGSLITRDPGAAAMSAAGWIAFSPSALSISSGQKSLVRVTVDVPQDAKPGVYRAGIFVQERPPATPPQKGEHTIMFRFRYIEILYVIVPPVAPDPHLVDAGMAVAANRLEMVCKMRNDGSGLVRPSVSLTLKDDSGKVAREEKYHQSTVLLPQASLSERLPLDAVPPGRYELSVAVDFHDGKAIQAMTRTVEIAATPPPPPGAKP